MFDKAKEECGVFGIFDKTGSTDVVKDTYLALYALQHRGQESTGIAVNDRGVISSYKDKGLVNEVLTEKVLKDLGSGQVAIGHVRYSTTGTNSRENAQPLVSKYVKGTIAVAHNGNLTNDYEIRNSLAREGAIFHSTNDSEVISYIIAKERIKTHNIELAVLNSMNTLKGAYSLVVMSPRKLIAARDPNGFRPLCMGKKDNAVIFASESCAIDAVGGEFIRDINPGEVVVCDETGVNTYQSDIKAKSGLCCFEYIYFARPDSVIDGASVHEARKEAGRLLAKSCPVDADIVCGVPDSGIDAALGYSQYSNIPYGVAFIKNRYIGRTFIQPTQGARESAVRIKLNVLKVNVKDKRVVLVDDSIVRGTTCAKIIELLREAGAKEVHFRISSPPFKNPCYFGTDIDSRDKLIACRMSLDEIRDAIGADSLGYLDIDDVHKIAKGCRLSLCDGCFTGKYPISVPEFIKKDKFEEKI